MAFNCVVLGFHKSKYLDKEMGSSGLKSGQLKAEYRHAVNAIIQHSREKEKVKGGEVLIKFSIS
ncbi:hypothetical protein ACF2G4_23185 (plasmid) [Pantoea sp. C3]|uniref:hypothetical protein n=1 Tax=Pantoea phytostimulans TaxID=2769024 RepID=UPI0038F80619